MGVEHNEDNGQGISKIDFDERRGSGYIYDKFLSLGSIMWELEIYD